MPCLIDKILLIYLKVNENNNNVDNKYYKIVINTTKIILNTIILCLGYIGTPPAKQKLAR